MPRTGKQLRSYLLEGLLPLWGDHGRDPSTGAFLYHLRHDGTPVGNPDRRLRIQARQTWVFSRAAMLGAGSWAESLAAEGADLILTRFRDESDGGFFLRLDPGLEPLDRAKELYEHAFVILALQAWGKSSGDARARSAALEALDWIDRNLADTEKGGFYDGVDAGGTVKRTIRRQNPHMHLFEAMLAWADSDPTGPWLERARILRGLFDSTFFDASNRTLTEFFDRDWVRAADESGMIVEPGHHFEWCFLLSEHDRLEGRAGWNAAQAALYDWAATYGVDPNGGAHNELDRTGRVLRASKRVWPQTEYMRAVATRLRLVGDPADRTRLDDVIDFVFDRYVMEDSPGWREELDERGVVQSDKMHATTVYHVMGGLLAAADAMEA